MTVQGEVLGFEEYVRTRQEALLRSARRLVPDPVDAQDLLQTALVRTYGRWDGIADKSLADAYLRRVMINTRTEWWRARKLDEVPTEQLPDASVDDGSEQRADRALLMDVLKVLAPKQRSVVVLRHWEQMSTEETAAALGMSTGTVKSTLHRALARLRQELESRAQECEDLQLGERALRAVRSGGGRVAGPGGSDGLAAPRAARDLTDRGDLAHGSVRTRDRVGRQRQDGRGQERCAA
ncbi:SigE family RNA polymerase sigma factor [Streptomyces sp. NPDC020875]|uniref:SigE family RNA polymerase sigma factor n=1 Tax=Streptomyces sp. NPDC020875 TaxID=3154898 RepID=UPI0034037864